MSKTQEVMELVDNGNVYWLDIRQIVSNVCNMRTSVPNVEAAGYGLFTPQDKSDKLPLAALAFSEDEEKQKEFVELFKTDPDDRSKGDAGIIGMADSIRKFGQLQPVCVREVDGGYDLEFGNRRVMACLYNYLVYGLPARVEARVVVSDEDEAVGRNIAENEQRLQLTPIEEALQIKRLKKRGCKIREIEEKTGLDSQVIRLRLKLLDLEADEREMVHTGEMTQQKALAMLEKREKGEKDDGKPKGSGVKGDGRRRRVPTLKEFEKMYFEDETIGEEVRKFIAAKVLDLPYTTLVELKKIQAEAEAAKNVEATVEE